MDWNEARASAIIAARQHESGALLPILHDLQEEFGFVPPQSLPMIAQALNLSRAEVHGVVTFYHDFRHEKPARHRLRLCRAEACQSLGGERIAAHAKARLDLDWHGATPDGALSLEPVFCLGLCASGPAALFDDAPLGRLDEAAIDRLLENAR